MELTLFTLLVCAVGLFASSSGALNLQLLWCLFGAAAAIAAAAMVATSPALIEYSVNARGYTILALSFLVAVGCTSYLLERQSLAAWCLWVLSLAVGFFTIPVMLYGFAALVPKQAYCGGRQGPPNGCLFGACRFRRPPLAA